jgi:hypothetical protein
MAGFPMSNWPPASECPHRRACGPVQLLEQNGVIARHVAILDPQKLGLTGVTSVFLTINRMSQDIEAFEKAVMIPPVIQECFLIAGSSDCLVCVIYRIQPIWSASTPRS